MLDSIYHMTYTLKTQFWRKNVIILTLCMQGCYGRHNVSRKSINHEWFKEILLHGVISLPDAMSCDKYFFYFSFKQSYEQNGISTQVYTKDKSKRLAHM